MIDQNNKLFSGLTSDEAAELQKKHGKNVLVPEKKGNLLKKIADVLKEPMFLLLFFAALIYFMLGEPRDGAVMLVFVAGIIGIEAVQEWKTDKTLKALKSMSEPQCTVIRDGEQKTVASADIVPGDLFMVSEGIKIPADGFVVKESDCCVDESTLTGEPETVWKSAVKDIADIKSVGEVERRSDYCFAGTLVMQGSAVILTDKTGANTQFGKIGAHVAKAPQTNTPLKKQTAGLVRFFAGIAAALFLLVMAVTWVNIPDHAFADRFVESILSGITLAMAMIPEEFPVILTVFLSMGAWRLAKKQSLVRKLPAIETLGAVSVLCVDKTGTITMNQMKVSNTWIFHGNEREFCEIMFRACETDAYDPMEKAMIEYCGRQGVDRVKLLDGELVREYPFTNSAKMMGHVWRYGSGMIVAAKGSPEKIMSISELADAEFEVVESRVREMSEKGLRVIAVASARIDGEKIPETLEECRLKLHGLVGLADPPRENIKDDIERCTRAGIRVVMITGDNGITAAAIARQVGIQNCEKVITGDELSRMTDDELREKVRGVNIFSRVVPEQKMRIVKSLKADGGVVAMTGDGVNDAPALKYADIGISMGKHGSEVSREASDIILLDDNFSTIVDTVKDGRRIYDNIRKAVGYILTIHIPIAAASLLAPIMHINPNFLMLLPVHVVLLELIIDPTCSVVLERQPAESDVMDRPPRAPSERLLDLKLAFKSAMQGIVMFAASFLTYLHYLDGTAKGAALARTMGLAIIALCNLFLVVVNSSDAESAVKSLKKLKKDKVMWGVVLLTLAGLSVIMYTPASGFLKLCGLNVVQLLTVLVISFFAVMWFDAVKLIKKLAVRSKKT